MAQKLAPAEKNSTDISAASAAFCISDLSSSLIIIVARKGLKRGKVWPTRCLARLRGNYLRLNYPNYRAAGAGAAVQDRPDALLPEADDAAADRQEGGGGRDLQGGKELHLQVSGHLVHHQISSHVKQ